MVVFKVVFYNDVKITRIKVVEIDKVERNYSDGV